MSMILMVGKTCLACSDCEDGSMKLDFQSSLYGQSSDALAEFSMLYEYELISYDEFVEFCSMITSLRLLCFRCDGNKQLVFHEIEASLVPAIEAGAKINLADKEAKPLRRPGGNLVEYDFVNKKLIKISTEMA